MTRTVTQLQGERGKLVRPCNVDAFPLEILARDFHYAAIAAAIGPPKLKDHIIDKLRGAPSFRILQSLKNHADFDPPVLHDRQIPQMWLPRGADGEPHVVPPGTKVILLFDASPEETDRVYFGEAVVPLTAANLAAVQRGIARDALADRQ
jgi:hypothetical protein